MWRLSRSHYDWHGAPAAMAWLRGRCVDLAMHLQVGIYDRDATKTWVCGPVVLAGDAAAPIPPNLGQGGNKALENAGLLAACLTR